MFRKCSCLLRDKEQRKKTETPLYYRKDTVLIYDAQVQRILYSCNNVCGGGRGGFTNRDRQSAKGMRTILWRKKQLFQYASVTGENQMIYLFYVGKSQFCEIRNDLSLQCLFNSQTIALLPLFLFLHINQPLGDQAPPIRRPFPSYLCLTCSVCDLGQITNIFCKMRHLVWSLGFL